VGPIAFARDLGRALDRVNARYAAYLAAGMPLEAYPGETIQCRNELDRTNWLGLEKKCEWAKRDERLFYEALQLPVPEVLGDFQIPEPGIRCTSNTFVRPTVAETALLMEALLDYALAAQANWWRLKDAVRSAATKAEMDAVNLEEGWP
jgi:hypothetical protein